MNSSQNAPYVPNPAPIKVVYEDPDLAVVVKPANVLTVPGKGPAKTDCAESRLKAEGRPFVRAAHRLDQDTSGLLIFGLSPAGHRAANMMFEARTVKKQYEALVWGSPPSERQEWQIDLPLMLDWPHRPRHIVDHANGKPSQTHVRVLNRGDGRLRLALSPLTGRSHQLRVHLSHTGLPICGDPLYGLPNDGFKRLCLHASYLAFDHPLRGKSMQFTSTPDF